MKGLYNYFNFYSKLLPLIIITFSLQVNGKPKGFEPIVNILDTKVLNKLEQSGFSLAETLGHNVAISKTSELYKNVSWYKDFVNVISKPIPHNKKNDQLPLLIPENHGDIPNMVRLFRNFEDKGARSKKDLKGGYYIRELSNNSKHPYTVEYDGDEPRHFDPRWLNSKFGYMKLIAVVNRMDRADFGKSNCGEVRFIYRLSYKSSFSSSSMPFFINIVHEYPKKKSCSTFAKSWYLKEINSSSLSRGPLKNLKFRQLEVNFQALRFTSGYMHGFGGQAMYMQRILRKYNNKLIPSPLENTPNVLAIQKNPELLKQFVKYLKDTSNLKALDQGTLNINFNPKFLAKFSVSWSTLGRARTANRPYSEIFKTNQKLLKSIDLSSLKYIKNHEALVERLNNLTCMGCHQSGGTAGFHSLGFPDNSFSHSFNRQELALSPHASTEVNRRKAYTAAIAKKQTPNSFRPHSIFSKANWKEAKSIPHFTDLNLADLCIPSPKFFSKTPRCSSNIERPLECRITVTTKNKNNLIGECVLKKTLKASGSICWHGEIKENLRLPSERGEIPTFNFFAFQDKWKLKGSVFKNKKSYLCQLPKGGAPLGRMGRKCSIKEEKLNISLDSIPHEVCANQGGKGFDMCAASGDSGACLESKVSRGMLDTCHPERFCREDYICQKFPDYTKISNKNYIRKKGNKLINRVLPKEISKKTIQYFYKRNIGFCVPTYFLFNMRVDGHPSPVTGSSLGPPKYDRTRPLRGYKTNPVK